MLSFRDKGPKVQFINDEKIEQTKLFANGLIHLCPIIHQLNMVNLRK